MHIKKLISDQLYNWSDYNQFYDYIYYCFYYKWSCYFYGRTSCHNINKAALSAKRRVDEETMLYKKQYIKRLINREIQALWQSKLSLRSRKRTWSKVFSFSEFSKNQTDYDLYCSRLQGASFNRVEQLSSNKACFGRNKQNQPRIIEAQRATIGWIWQYLYLSSKLKLKQNRLRYLKAIAYLATIYQK